MKNKLLVTGGAGYVGSHACKALSRAGYTPVTVDNLSTANDIELVQFGPFVELDIRDTIALSEVMREHEIDTVLHFAGSAYVGESQINPAKYYSNNLISTYSLLEAMRISGANKLVFSSSCATYGVSQTGYFDEMHPQVPINVYGRTKLFSENVIRDYCSAYGFSACSLRYFNAAGADPDGVLGERHEPETHLIPLAILAAMGRGEALKVFGSDYETKDGSCIRDYTHVSDLADAHVLAVDYLKNWTGFKAFNLGTGQGTSVLEIIEAVERVLGKQFPYKVEARRIGDPPILVAENGQAKEKLNWAPKFLDINEIVATAANYLKRII
jgi:UDP-arabinose 4-epimerase